MKKIIGVILIICTVVLASFSAIADDFNGKPTDPVEFKKFDYDSSADSSSFWYDDYVNVSFENGNAVFAAEKGKSWGLVWGSSPEAIPFEAGKDYTVMLRYKSHKMTPEYQFVLFGTKDGKEVDNYCYRWNTQDFSNSWSFQCDPKTGTSFEWLGDFQAAKDGEYSIVSLHFYVVEGMSNIYFKICTCESQSSKPLNFSLDCMRVFSGYAGLNSAEDFSSDKPSKPSGNSSTGGTAASSDTSSATTASTDTQSPSTNQPVTPATSSQSSVAGLFAEQIKANSFPLSIPWTIALTAVATMILTLAVEVCLYFAFIKKRIKNNKQSGDSYES